MIKNHIIYPAPIKTQTNSTNRAGKKPIKQDLFSFKKKKKNEIWGLLKIYVKYLLPHMLAIVCSVVMMKIHSFINNFCFIPPKCNCEDNILIKIYSAFKLFFQTICPMFLIGHMIFVIKEFNHLKVKIFYFTISSLTIFGFFMLRSGSNPSENDTFINTFMLSWIPILFLWLIIKEKCRISAYLKKISNSLILSCMAYMDFIFYSFIFVDLQKYFVDYFGEYQGKKVYHMFISIYNQIWFSFAKLALKNFGEFAIKEGFPHYYLCQYLRYFLLKIFALNLTSVVLNDLESWVLWVLYGSHIFLLFRIFSNRDPFLELLKKIKLIIFEKKKNKIKLRFPYANRGKMIQNDFSLYLIDSQHIFITRILLLWSMKQWFTINRINFLENCSLDISGSFYISFTPLIIFIFVNVFVSSFYVIWILFKYGHFILENEEILSIKCWVYILIFYSMFEVQFQEYYTIFLIE